MSKYFVYIIQSNKGLLYKGFTNDLEKRLLEHNNGLGKWTKSRGPFKLVYFEEHEIKSVAMQREHFFKSGKGREFLKNLLNN